MDAARGGGYGLVRDELSATGASMPPASLWRDARIGEIYGGAKEIPQWLMARNIFGRECSG